MQPVDEHTTHSIVSNPIFLGVAGGAVGVGIMILALAKWGRKWFGDAVAADNCPYAADHPLIQKYMGESTRDREDLRKFLEGVSAKVDVMATTTGKIEGKLDLLLQGARVRWNTGLIPQDDTKK